jgi:hypothetical protein
MKACEDLVMNGYSDWRLPTKDESVAVIQELKYNKIGGLLFDDYWSSDKNNEGLAFIAHEDFQENGFYDLDSKHGVRPVRGIIQQGQNIRILAKPGSHLLNYFKGRWNLRFMVLNEEKLLPLRFDENFGVLKAFLSQGNDNVIESSAIKVEGNSIILFFTLPDYGDIKISLQEKNNNTAIGKVLDILDVVAEKIN